MSDEKVSAAEAWIVEGRTADGWITVWTGDIRVWQLSREADFVAENHRQWNPSGEYRVVELVRRESAAPIPGTLAASEEGPR